MNSFMLFITVIISLSILMKIMGMGFTLLPSYPTSSVCNKRAVRETFDVKVI